MVIDGDIAMNDRFSYNNDNLQVKAFFNRFKQFGSSERGKIPRQFQGHALQLVCCSTTIVCIYMYIRTV